MLSQANKRFNLFWRVALHCKFQRGWITTFSNFDRRSCNIACRFHKNETGNVKFIDWTVLSQNIRHILPASFFCFLNLHNFLVLFISEKCVYLIGAHFAQKTQEMRIITTSWLRKNQCVYLMSRTFFVTVNVCVTKSWKVSISRSEICAFGTMTTVFREFLPLDLTYQKTNLIWLASWSKHNMPCLTKLQLHVLIEQSLSLIRQLGSSISVLAKKNFR